MVVGRSERLFKSGARGWFVHAVRVLSARFLRWALSLLALGVVPSPLACQGTAVSTLR